MLLSFSPLPARAPRECSLTNADTVCAGTLASSLSMLTMVLAMVRPITSLPSSRATAAIVSISVTIRL